MTDHLAVLHSGPLDRILSGEKTIESRLSRDRRPPYGRVEPGDQLWLKQASGPVVATATIAEVWRFDGLTPERVGALLVAFPGIHPDPGFREAKRSARYATLMRLVDIAAIAPIRISGRGRSAWRVLPEPLSPTREKPFGRAFTAR